MKRNFTNLQREVRREEASVELPELKLGQSVEKKSCTLTAGCKGELLLLKFSEGIGNKVSDYKCSECRKGLSVMESKQVRKSDR